MFTTTERKRKRVRLKSFRCRTAQVAGRKGHAIFKCPPALPSGARSPRSQSTPHFRDRLRPFSFRDRSFTCQLIFPTPRNQSFAYIREGRGPAPRRRAPFWVVRHSGEPNPKAPGRQGGREACPQNQSPHWLHCLTRGCDGAAALLVHWSGDSMGWDLARPKFDPRFGTGFRAQLPCVPGAAGGPGYGWGNGASWGHRQRPVAASYHGRSCCLCCWRWPWPPRSTPSGAAGIAGLRSCQQAGSCG